MTTTTSTPAVTRFGASLALAITLLVPAAPLALSTMSDSTDTLSGGIIRRGPLQGSGEPMAVIVPM